MKKLLPRSKVININGNDGALIIANKNVRIMLSRLKNRENFSVDLIISIYLFIQQILFVRIPARHLVHLIVGSCM